MAEYVLFGMLIVYLFGMEAFLNRRGDMTLTKALSWAGVYIYVAVVFAVYLWFTRGHDTAILFVTAYGLEKALSVDNLMVFTGIFAYYGVKPQFRHKVLHWGLVGAAVFRIILTVVGVQFLNVLGPWAEVIFAVLVSMSIMAILRGSDDTPVDHEGRWYVRWTKRLIRVTDARQLQHKFGGRGVFPVRMPGYLYRTEKQWYVTPLFLCLITIEVSDVMFAMDSVPTVIAVARDPFIIYSAMMLAIMGLRCLYFVLEHYRRILRFLNVSIAVVLAFVAFKLVAHASAGLEIAPLINMALVGAILGGGVIASLTWPGIPSGPEA
jgi:tellurite resistance protein TerC